MFEVFAFGRIGPPILGVRLFQTALLIKFFLSRENNEIANVLLSGSQKGSNLRLKCTRIRLAAAQTRWELKHFPDPLAIMTVLFPREEGRVETGEGRGGGHFA